jgi:hypothetical protein
VRLVKVCDPLIALVPIQPPDAVQLVAFVELHVSVDDPPDATDVEDQVRLTVGRPTCTVPYTPNSQSEYPHEVPRCVPYMRT